MPESLIGSGGPPLGDYQGTKTGAGFQGVRTGAVTTWAMAAKGARKFLAWETLRPLNQSRSGRKEKANSEGNGREFNEGTVYNGWGKIKGNSRRYIAKDKSQEKDATQNSKNNKCLFLPKLDESQSYGKQNS